MAHAHKLLYLVGLGLLGLFMTGCGGEPSPPPPSVTFTITRSANPPDAIAGHAYTVFIATSLPSAIVPTDVVTSCSLTGSVPSGMTAAPGTPSSGAADYCVLSMSSASAAGTYSFTLQAADASTPAKVASQTYTLSIRPDFTFTTAALAQGVQGRTYGVAPLSQPEATNIGTTQGGLTVGNAPLTACTLVSVTPSNPGLAVALDATKTQCLLSSPALKAAGTFSVTVSATETQITDSVTGVLAVPAAPTTPVASTLPLVANPPITLAVNLGSSWPNAVSDRLYGSGSGCSGAGGACVPAIYTATGGLGGYVFPASTPGSMPAGIACPAVSGSTTYTCSAPTPGIAATPGTYSPSVTVTDTANAATPAATTATDPLSTRRDTLTVNAEMSVTPPTTAPAPAVTGRRYGTGAGCSGGNCVALDYKLNNGLGNYTLTGSSLTTPQDTFTCTLTSPNFFCSDAAIAGTTSPATLTFVGADAGNASTPGNTKTDNSQTLPIVPEMTVTPPSTAPVTAVTGRRYGTGAGCSGGACVALDYKLNNGLGNYTLTGSSLTTPQDTFTCTLTSPNFYCSDAAIAGTASPATLAFVGAETGNISTPGNTKTDTSQSLSIVPEMTVTAPTPAPAVTGRRYGTGTGCSGGSCVALDYKLNNGLGNYTLTGSSLTTPQDTFACTLTSPNFYCSDAAIAGTTSPATLTFAGAETGNASTPGNTKNDTSQSLTITPELTVTPPSPAPVTAVTGRRYGTGAGCSGGNCVALDYKLNNGLGNYTLTGSSLTTPQDAFTCTLTSPNFFCSDAAIVGTTSPATLTFVGADAGNASTPGNTKTDTSQTLAIVPEMTVTPPSPAPVTAVTGRRYGTGAGCSGGSCVALNYKLNNGLGNYTLTGSSLTTAQDAFTCTLTSPNYFCSDGTILGTTTPATLTFVGAETGNASTPGNTKTDTSQTLAIVPELTVTPPASVAAAVTGRRYGTGAGCSGGSCVALNYKLNNGLGNYTLTGTSLTTPQDTFICTLTSPNFFCSDGAIAGTTTPATLTFIGAETGDISTPGNTKTDTSQSLTINAVLTVNNPTPFPVPAAVTGRLYGSGSGCSAGSCVPLAYNPSGGITPYTTITGSGFPAPITCAQSSNTLNCSASTGITGSTATGTINVTDSSNAATPSGTTSRSSDSVTVDPALAITNTVLPNGLLGFEYNPSGPGVTLTTTGGLGTTLTWVGPGATAGACSTAPTGTLDPDLTLSSAGLLSSDDNALTTLSTAATQWTFQVCVSDTGNATTPAGFALPATTGNDFVVNVMDTLAYVAENSANKVAIINTTSNTAGTPLSTNISTPDSVAISPNGRLAYVTMGNNKIAVVDTITQGHFGNSPFALPAGCVAPTGIAITPDGTQFYVACPGGNEVLVFSAITATTTSPLTALATISTGAGSTPDSVAFKPDGTRAYVTLSGNNKLAIINTSTQAQITSSPFTLSAINTGPLGIALATNGSEIYAYIAKNAAGSGQPGVEVEDITSDPSTSPLTPVANIQTGASSAPDSVAVLPDSSRVYAALEGANQFAVIDNTVATPAQITGSPYNLPDPAFAATASAPLGVTSPPLSSVPVGGYRVYLCLSNAAQSNVAVMDDLGNTTTTPHTPAEDSASPVVIDASATPTGIEHIPVPK